MLWGTSTVLAALGFSGLTVAQTLLPATLQAHSVICVHEADIYALLNFYQLGDNESIMQYMAPGKCALTQIDQQVQVVNYIPGRSWTIIRSKSGDDVYTFSQRVVMGLQ